MNPTRRSRVSRRDFLKAGAAAAAGFALAGCGAPLDPAPETAPPAAAQPASPLPPAETPIPTAAASATPTSTPTPAPTRTASPTLRPSRTSTITPTPSRVIHFPVEFKNFTHRHEQGAKIEIVEDPHKGRVFRAYADGPTPEIDFGKRRGYLSYRPVGVRGPFAIEFDAKIEDVEWLHDGGDTFTSLLTLKNGFIDETENWSNLALVNAEPFPSIPGRYGLELSTYGWFDDEKKSHVMNPAGPDFPFGEWIHLQTVFHADGLAQAFQDGVLVVESRLLVDPQEHLNVASFHAGLYGRFNQAVFYNGPITISLFG